MPIQFRCPKCQTTDAAEDHLAGTQVRCKQCGSLLQLPGQTQQIREGPGGGMPPPAPLPPVSERPEPRRRQDEPYDDEPRYRRDDDYGMPSRELSPSWGTVRTGLGIMFWTMIAMVIGAVVFVLLLFMSGMAMGMQQRQFGRGGAEPVFLILMIGGCSLLVAALIYFIGQCMCCAAPPESQARGYAIGSVICTVLIVVGYLGMGAFVAATGGGFAGGPDFLLGGGGRGMALGMLVFGVLMMGLGLVAHILFITFLKTVARYFGNESLARSANGYLILYVIFIVWYVISQVVQFAMLGAMVGGGGIREAQGLIMGIACLTIVLALAVFVWYLVLLFRTRDTIRQGMVPATY